MLEAGRHEPMNAFAPWLYHTLYLNPQAYFAVAKLVPGTPCFFASEAPLVLVAKGEVEPTQEEYEVMERFLVGKRDEDARAQGVRGRVINLLRLGVFFQRGDYYHQSFPHGRFSFVAHDGERYTVFAFSDTRSKFDW